MLRWSMCWKCDQFKNNGLFDPVWSMFVSGQFPTALIFDNLGLRLNDHLQYVTQTYLNRTMQLTLFCGEQESMFSE